MPHRIHLLLLMCLAWTGVFAIDGPIGQVQRTWAQDSERSSRSEGESKEERKERFKRYLSERGGDKDRDGRGDRSRGDEGRGSDERSSSSSSSSSGPSSGSSSGSSHATPNSSSATSTPQTTTTTGSKAGSMSIDIYAKGLVKDLDKNGNHWIDGDERKGLRSPAADSDLNNDGAITTEELVAHLSARAPASPTSTSSSSASLSGGGDSSGDHDRDRSGRRRHDGDDRSKNDAEGGAQRVFIGSAGGIASTTKEGDKRHSYRFTPASERLPAGLPSWFKSKDSNGDGQISMSEYSRSWSTRTASEFRQIDVNGDGVVTTKEAAKKSSTGG